MNDKTYLTNYDINEALDKYIKLLNIKESTEETETKDSLGRISSEGVYAKISNPFYNCSAMDGIAVKAVKTHGANEKNHVILKKGTDYEEVDTGDPIPENFDAVIMVEDIVKESETSVRIHKSAATWENIRSLGEDIVESTLIIGKNHKIRPVDIGAMIAGGISKVRVYKKPLVGIIPTGDEIVELNDNLKIGDIIEFNSKMFAAQVNEWGMESKVYGIAKDKKEEIIAALEKAYKECDVVIINAGSSAGREDYTYDAISALGTVHIHGIAIKPGKPAILAEIEGKPVIGVPGYPVSAYFVMENIVKPVISKYINFFDEKEEIEAVLSRRVMSSLKYLEFIRVKIGLVDDKYIATPLQRGAGTTMSLVNCDGVLEVPQNYEGYEKGETVKLKLLKTQKEIKNTLVLIGSHDPILDTASDMMKNRNFRYTLSSAHVGSMGGITALRNEECHISTMHLLDEETGEYNIPFIKKYIPGKELVLIKFVKRTQGIMLRKDRNFSASSIEDIKNNNLSFVNRQKGSGTRLLFDYELKKAGISPDEIKGYEREELTHLAVAAAVKNGDADCGIGVYSAANIMNLDFMPIGDEHYDLVMPVKYLGLESFLEFINTIKSDEYKKQLDKMGGYAYDELGKMIYL